MPKIRRNLQACWQYAGWLFLLSWKLLLVCMAVVPFLTVASVKFQRDSRRAYLRVRDRIGETLTSLQEGISGVRVTQAFARESVETDRFAETNASLFRTHMDSVRIAAWYLPIVDFSGAATTALSIGVGGWMIRDGQVTVGTVVAFILLLQTAFEPVQQLSQLFNMLQSAGASLAKLYELLDTPIDITEPDQPVALAERGEVVVSDVGFAYAKGEPVLSGGEPDRGCRRAPRAGRANRCGQVHPGQADGPLL